MSSPNPDARATVALLRSRTRPLALAGERVLPLHPVLAGLFPGGGLRRGSVVGCRGSMSYSVALALSATASHSGAWTALVGVRGLGLAAAAEWGMSLERLVGVGVAGCDAPDRTRTDHAVPASQVLAAAIDGFDIVIASSAGIRPSEARRLAARLLQRGSVLLLIGHSGAFEVDLVCSAQRPRWWGVGSGHGRLLRRAVELEVSGRRADRARCAALWFPSSDGGVAAREHRGVEQAEPLRVTLTG